MKKTYLKPDADYIKFYADEELTTNTDISQSVTEGGTGEGDKADDGWD